MLPAQWARNGLGGDTSCQAPAVSLPVVTGNIGIRILCISPINFVNLGPVLGDRWALELLTRKVSGPTWLWAKLCIVANSVTQVYPARPLGSSSNFSYSLTYPHSAPMAISSQGSLPGCLKIQNDLEV